jgi:oxygen-independent coproporphyrinogen-3 oxidase
MSNEKWKQNIETALSLEYRTFQVMLTVEPKTALNKLIQTGKNCCSKDEVAQEHFAILVETLEFYTL